MVLSNGKRPDLVIQLENGIDIFIDLRWKELLDTQGDPFLPICHERGGLISDGALNLLRLASLQFSPSLHAQTAYTTYWLSRLHIANTRGVADVINAKLPYQPDEPLTTQASSSFIVYPSHSFGAFVPLHHPIPTN